MNHKQTRTGCLTSRTLPHPVVSGPPSSTGFKRPALAASSAQQVATVMAQAPSRFEAEIRRPSDVSRSNWGMTYSCSSHLIRGKLSLLDPTTLRRRWLPEWLRATLMVLGWALQRPKAACSSGSCPAKPEHQLRSA